MAGRVGSTWFSLRDKRRSNDVASRYVRPPRTMSDRLLISLASVPMLCSIGGLVLLQRAAPIRLEALAPVSSEVTAEPAMTRAARPWVGVVVAEYTAELAADAEGRVSEVLARTGAHVEAGEKLLQLDGADVSSAVGMASAELEERRSEASRAAARATAAKSKLGRLHEGEQWLSRQEVDTATAEVEVANAELRAARAAVRVGTARVEQQRTRLSRQALVAPFAGTIVGLEVDPGDSVRPGQILMRVHSDVRQVRFAFPEGALDPAKSPDVRIKLVGSSASTVARVSFVRPELDPSAALVFGTAALPAELPEASRWIPGASVEVSPASAPEGR
jgi:RND family efflux transporter MFP subunit